MRITRAFREGSRVTSITSQQGAPVLTVNPSIASPTEGQDWSSEVGKLDFRTAQVVFLWLKRISMEKPHLGPTTPMFSMWAYSHKPFYTVDFHIAFLIGFSRRPSPRLSSARRFCEQRRKFPYCEEIWLSAEQSAFVPPRRALGA